MPGGIGGSRDGGCRGRSWRQPGQGTKRTPEPDLISVCHLPWGLSDLRHDHKAAPRNRSISPIVPMAKLGDPAAAGSSSVLYPDSSQQTHTAPSSPVSPGTQNAPCKMAAGYSAFLHRGGFAKWKILHT